MKRDIIKIKDISHGIPKYKVWYKYYDDIFISVIYKNKSRRSHLRIKSQINNTKQKRDNKMCFWHSDWQYSKFENTYGISKTGNKTYEINIKQNEEIHRIDTLIENVAIEFQHTLEVSINEMDSRYTAHKKSGLTPYLVLDLTDFTAKKTLLSILSFSTKKTDYYILNSTEETSLFFKKIRKWFTSKYYISGNLFIDFSDTIIRFTPILEAKYLIITKEDFLNNILTLEQTVLSVLNKEKDNKVKEKNKKENEENEKKRQRQLEYLRKVKNNDLNIENNSKYKLYRFCLSHPKIKKIVSTEKNVEIINFNEFYDESKKHIKESHIYSFFQSANSKAILEIEITQYFDIESLSYLFSKIFITKKYGQEGIIILEFIWPKAKKIRKTSKKLGLAKDFLHSTTHPAFYKYDINEKLVSKEYYLFNKKVSKQEVNDLRMYFELGMFEDEYLYTKYENLIKEISGNDEYGLITGFCQNFITESSLDNYYRDIKKWKPLSATNSW